MNIYKEDWTDPRPGVFFLNRDGLYDCRPGRILKITITEEDQLRMRVDQLREDLAQTNRDYEGAMKSVASLIQKHSPKPLVVGQTIVGQLEDLLDLKADATHELLKLYRDARAGEASAVNDCVQKNIQIEDLNEKIEDMALEAESRKKDGYDFARKFNELSDKYAKLQVEYLKSEARLRASRMNVDHFRNEELAATRRGNALYSENEKNKKRMVDLEKMLKTFDPPFIGGYSPRALAWRAIEATYRKQASALPKTIRYKVAARVFDIPEDKAIHVCEALNLDAFAPGYVHIEHPLDNLGGAK